MKRIALRILAVLAILWLGFVALVYRKMTAPPEEFTAFMAKLPMPAMMLFPFQTMWFSARAGALQPGDMAPDFKLETVDRASSVQLSSHTGVRPVVLVFGSYT